MMILNTAPRVREEKNNLYFRTPTTTTQQQYWDSAAGCPHKHTTQPVQRHARQRRRQSPTYNLKTFLIALARAKEFRCCRNTQKVVGRSSHEQNNTLIVAVPSSSSSSSVASSRRRNVMMTCLRYLGYTFADVVAAQIARS